MLTSFIHENPFQTAISSGAQSYLKHVSCYSSCSIKECLGHIDLRYGYIDLRYDIPNECLGDTDLGFDIPWECLDSTDLRYSYIDLRFDVPWECLGDTDLRYGKLQECCGYIDLRFDIPESRAILWSLAKPIAINKSVLKNFQVGGHLDLPQTAQCHLRPDTPHSEFRSSPAESRQDSRHDAAFPSAHK